jgi:NarL family two-component system response regulator LiaR
VDKRIRIVIADDHAVVREGLRTLLATESQLQLVGEAADGVEAVAQVRAQRPDVALLDLVMPRMGGVEAIEAIHRDVPDTRVLVFSNYADDDNVFSAIRAGAAGYVLKDASPHELISAIRQVAQGEAALHPSVARKVLEELSRPPVGQEPALTEEALTEREVEVLRLVARGHSNQEIADQLWVTERTVRAHVSAILHKLQLANRTQAALYALREGLADLDEPDET